MLHPLVSFLKNHQDTDILCFQEVYHNAVGTIVNNETPPKCLDIYDRLTELLPNHKPYFRPVVKGVYGLSTFIKRDLEVVGEGEESIYENPTCPDSSGAHSRILQWLTLKAHNQAITVVNVHGLWNGKGKLDVPERLDQSQRIRTFMASCPHPLIVCGDFNLSPGTESLNILTEGMQDFIALTQAPSTRSSFYQKPERYADYILASPQIQAHHFAVLPDEVSDHLPLYLEFQVGDSKLL